MEGLCPLAALCGMMLLRVLMETKQLLHSAGLFQCMQLPGPE